MKICIIGHKNHSKRLEKILYSLGYKDIFLFNHNIHVFDIIKDYDIFFISSPNTTHSYWIHKLTNLDKYVFCEKPPVTTLQDLQKITLYNPKLYFNFNYRFTKLATIVKSYIKNNKLGKPLYVNCISSTGLAFNESFNNDWRFIGNDIFSSIIGNVGIHYIDMISYIFGSIDDININNLHITSKKLPDTSNISMKIGNISIDIFVSYAAPFHNEIKVIFDNGIIFLKNGVVSISTPRDTFDSNNRFISPNNKVLHEFANSKEYFDMSLKASINFFLQRVKQNSNLPLKFYTQSIDTTKLIINNTKYD